MITKELYITYKARGYSDQQIILLTGCTKKDLKKFKTYTTRKEIPAPLMAKAKELGLHPDTVRWRMDVKHWSVEKACTEPKEEPRFTMEQLKKAPVHPTTVYRRVEKGWDPERALTEQSSRKKKRKKRQKREKCPCCGK